MLFGYLIIVLKDAVALCTGCYRNSMDFIVYDVFMVNAKCNKFNYNKHLKTWKVVESDFMFGAN